MTTTAQPRNVPICAKAAAKDSFDKMIWRADRFSLGFSTVYMAGLSGIALAHGVGNYEIPNIHCHVCCGQSIFEFACVCEGQTRADQTRVIDDGAYTNSSIKLHTKWTSPSPESGTVKFRYQIREGSTSGPIIVDWQSVGLTTEITHLGLSLFNGKTYYIGVKAINSEGKTSDVGYSDGITIAVNPALEVSHAPLDFSSTVGGSKSLSIKSSVNGLPWRATSSAPWLSLSSTSGTTPSNVVVNANSPGLAVGTHIGMINISAQAAQNSPVSIAANLIVTDGGADGKMKPVTIQGKRFYSGGKPYFFPLIF